MNQQETKNNVFYIRHHYSIEDIDPLSYICLNKQLWQTQITHREPTNHAKKIHQTPVFNKNVHLLLSQQTWCILETFKQRQW